MASACFGNVGMLPPAPDASTPVDAGVRDAGLTPDSGTPDSGTHDAGASDAGPLDAGATDAGPVDAGDFCNGALLCERFEGYPLGALSDGQNFGPWQAKIQDSNATASIDEMPSGSGNHALKVHIDNTFTSGAQLLSYAAPLFSPTRTKLYGKLRMYLAADATSEHWTMFGFSGNLPQGDPNAGAYATYEFSSFDDGMGHNQFGDVYGNDGTGQDCNTHSTQLMPVGRWACVSFLVDATAIQYRMWLDGTPVPSMSVDTMGLQCVDHTSNPWYGPDFSNLFVGAWSFHPMRAALDMWIDDYVVDINPVDCP